MDLEVRDSCCWLTEDRTTVSFREARTVVG